MSKIKLFSIILLYLIGMTHEVSWSKSMDNDNTSTTSSASTGQYLDDSVITAKVKSALMKNKHIKSLSISVKTINGVVTLSGNVKNEAQEKMAVRIASHVKGVQSVNDDLSIEANE